MLLEEVNEGVELTFSVHTNLANANRLVVVGQSNVKSTRLLIDFEDQRGSVVGDSFLLIMKAVE